MSFTVFMLSTLLVISIAISIMLVMNFNLKYKKLQYIYLRKERKLLEKELEQTKEIIALQNRAKVREIK